ncbi:hypothetical protein M9G88_002969 [Listeria monocytogenes]|nr:hypothetical protein [Listeria monocytogenes]EJF9294849.1 hypothetical protein [Listeria monocytogenes]EJF9310106.1 hypothetical protein [Listeria monocytogenes]EJF9313158.1 hypothetical protein [Listeria monocytogenes]EJF9319304.1 hypothetical protein [Listeria monocytogenes]
MMIIIVRSVSSAMENALTAKTERSYVNTAGMYIQMRNGTRRTIKKLRNTWLF